jgi:hypothetical protein
MTFYIYDLPPWFYMNVTYIMMSLLIQGAKQPEPLDDPTKKSKVEED